MNLLKFAISFFLGWLYSKTNRYEEVFFVAGGTMILCVILLSFIHWFLKRTPADRRVTDIQNANTELAINEMNGSNRTSERGVLLKIPRGNGCSITDTNTDELPLCVVHVSSV